MPVIEIILIFELIVLAVALLCWSTAYVSRPTDGSIDPFLLSLQVFWKTMLQHRLRYEPIGSRRRKPITADDDDDDVPMGVLLSESDAVQALAAAQYFEASDLDALTELGQAAQSERAQAGSVQSSGATAQEKPAKKRRTREVILRGGVQPVAVAVSELAIQVVANSPAVKILGRDSEGLRIAVTSSANDAMSNKMVLDLIASQFKIKPYQVSLVRGHYHANKLVKLAGVSQGQLDRVLNQQAMVES